MRDCTWPSTAWLRKALNLETAGMVRVMRPSSHHARAVINTLFRTAKQCVQAPGWRPIIAA
jgi:hypothetical protein